MAGDMKVWLFNLFPWSTYADDEIPYPFPGSMYDRDAGRELYDGCLALDRRADELGFDGIASASITMRRTAHCRRQI